MPFRKQNRPLVILSEAESRRLGDRSTDGIRFATYEDVLDQRIDITSVDTDLVLLPPALLPMRQVGAPLDVIGKWIRGCGKRLERLTVIYEAPALSTARAIEWIDLSPCHRLGHLVSIVRPELVLAFRMPEVAREPIIVSDPDGDHRVEPIGARVGLTVGDSERASRMEVEQPPVEHSARGERSGSAVALSWKRDSFEIRVVPRCLLSLLGTEPLPVALCPTRRIALELIKNRDRNAVSINGGVFDLTAAEMEAFEVHLESLRGPAIETREAARRMGIDEPNARKRRSRLNATLRAASWPIVSVRTHAWRFDPAFSISVRSRRR